MKNKNYITVIGFIVCLVLAIITSSFGLLKSTAAFAHIKNDDRAPTYETITNEQKTEKGSEFENKTIEKKNTENINDDTNNKSKGEITQKNAVLTYSSKKQNAENVNVVDETSCKAYCLIDAKSGEIIASSNEHKRLPIASMCKIMTLILCFENIHGKKIEMNEAVTVSERASGMGGSQVFLEAHKAYTVKDLIKSIVVASANDSCVAMAEKISGSVERFVDEMNKKAKELNMNDTNFVNPTGLPQEGQYSCAEDACKMFKKLVTFNEYFEFSRIWIDKIVHSEERYTEISNTNKLIKTYPSCDSGKTGYTSEAGHCVTASAERDGTRFIACVIGASDSKTRFKTAANLLDYGFNGFEYKEIIIPFEKLGEADISNAKENKIAVGTANPYGILLKRGETLDFDLELRLNKLKAPVVRGETVGELSIYVGGVEKTKLNLISLQSASKENFLDVIRKIADKFSIAA